MIKAKTVQLGIGTDLLAGRNSLNASATSELILTDRGVVACSNKAGRMVLIPDANVRGIELMPGTDLSQAPFNVKEWAAPKVRQTEVKLGPIPPSNVARRPGRPPATNNA